MLPFEKAELRTNFDESMHHLVTAMNVLMFFQRRELLDVGDSDTEAMKIRWNEANVKRFYNETMPQVYESLKKATVISNTLIGANG